MVVFFMSVLMGKVRFPIFGELKAEWVKHFDSEQSLYNNFSDNGLGLNCSVGLPVIAKRKIFLSLDFRAKFFGLELRQNEMNYILSEDFCSGFSGKVLLKNWHFYLGLWRNFFLLEKRDVKNSLQPWTTSFGVGYKLAKVFLVGNFDPDLSGESFGGIYLNLKTTDLFAIKRGVTRIDFDFYLLRLAQDFIGFGTNFGLTDSTVFSFYLNLYPTVQIKFAFKTSFIGGSKIGRSFLVYNLIEPLKRF